MFTNTALKNKHILITGGASGLGLAMAKHFLKHGAGVVICGRNQERLDAAIAALKEMSDKIDSYSVDVRDYAAVSVMMKELFVRHPINGLVNNAAGNFFCASEDLSENGFKSVIDIVLHGTFNCTQHFGRELIAVNRTGSVISIETTYAQDGAAFLLPSACAKAGVHALTTTLAYEWAEYGIRVNAIAPGPFPTPGAWSRLVPNKDFEALYKNRHPMKRFGEHEELANLALFLMSDLANYITGETVTIDGGERLGGSQFNFITQMMPRKQLKELFSNMKTKN